MRLSQARRSAPSLLLAAALVERLEWPCRLASAFEVPQRDMLEQQLYAQPPPTVVPYQQQVSDAITIRSMRGVWALEETIGLRGSAASGTLTFRGADLEEKGAVTYAGDATNGRGPWIIKSDGFGRSPDGRRGGAIEMKALWKLRRGKEGTFQYAGRVNVASYAADGLPNASIDGNIIALINGGKTKGGEEKKVGTFRATLLRSLTAAEEVAATDSAAAGGAPEALQLNLIMDERLVNKVYP